MDHAHPGLEPGVKPLCYRICGAFPAMSFQPIYTLDLTDSKRIELLNTSTELGVLPPLITTYHQIINTPTRKALSLKVVSSDPQELEGHSNPNEIRVRFRNEEFS